MCRRLGDFCWDNMSRCNVCCFLYIYIFFFVIYYIICIFCLKYYSKLFFGVIIWFRNYTWQWGYIFLKWIKQCKCMVNSLGNFPYSNASGQIITTSAEVTLNGGLVRESPKMPLIQVGRGWPSQK